jgi:hypothetical protein
MRRALARAVGAAAARGSGAGAGAEASSASAASASSATATASARLAGRQPWSSSNNVLRAFSSSSRAAAESSSVWEAASPARQQLFAELSLARGMLPHRGGLVAAFSPHGVSLLPSHMPRAAPPPLDDAELGLREADENELGEDEEEVGLDLAGAAAGVAAAADDDALAAAASPLVAQEQAADGAMYADSVKRKRKLKMKRHKHRKRLKKMRSQA